MSNRLPTLSNAEQTVDDADRGFGCLSTPRGNLPLKRLNVEARIDGLVSSVRVRQTFVNALSGASAVAETGTSQRSAAPARGEALEATYVFPLPERAAVTRFQMRVGQRTIEGALRERGEARREYSEALAQGHRAAIAEEDRSGVFTICVGNILPREEAEVTLELTGPLQFDDGEATFRFPLVVAPRYIPGAVLPGESVGDGTALDADAVPDASRVTPPVLEAFAREPVQSEAVQPADTGAAISKPPRKGFWK